MKISIINRKNKENLIDKSKDIISDTSKFAIIEGYKIARANLMFSLSARDSKCVAITSWSKGEGKSTATTNIAISFSKMGKKVLLIDADLRRPNVHALTKTSNMKGFSEILSKIDTFDNVVQRDVLPCLDVLTSGPIPPNPSELLCSTIMPSLMEKLNKEYDYIIIDTPPVGVVADALLLKTYVGGYVAVVRERVTTHGDLEKLIQNTSLAETKILGIVKLGCENNSIKYKKRGYNYYQYY